MTIDSKIIKFKQVGPDIDLSLAFGDHLRNMQIKKNCHRVKFSTPGGNYDSDLYWTQINQNINFCVIFQVISGFCLTIKLITTKTTTVYLSLFAAWKKKANLRHHLSMEKDISNTTNNFNPYQAVKFVPAFQGDDIEKCFQIFEKAALSTMWPELSWVLL